MPRRRRLAADLGSAPLSETLDGLPTGASGEKPISRRRSADATPCREVITLEKTPGELPRRGWSAQVVTRSSRNDVAMDADAKSVVVLVLDGVESGRF